MGDIAESVQTNEIASLKQRIDELTDELARRRKVEDELRASIDQHRLMQAHVTALVDASATLTDMLKPSAVLSSILQLAKRLLPADAYAIWRLHAPSGRWRIALAAGLSDEYQQEVVREPNEATRMSDAPVVADDVFNLPLIADRQDAYRAEGIRSMLVVPLRIHGAVLGTLVFYHRQPHRTSEIEVTLASAVANLSGAMIGSADLFEEQVRLENRFSRFMHGLPGLAWIKDLEGRYVYANDAAVHVFQHSREELYGRRDEEIFPAETAAQFQENDRQALVSGTAVQIIETLRHADGVEHHSIVSKFPIPDCGGEPALIGGMAIDITEHRRTELDARFLANASAALAGLVDYESTLQNVARQAVPTFADWCAVDLLDADGSLRRLAVAHVDPAKVALAIELQRRYPPPVASHGAWNIVRTGKSELIAEITQEMLTSRIKDAEQLRIVRELGLKSYMGVPLITRGQVLGVMTFVAAESGRRYDGDDLAVAEDLAHRAAVAIENARLYEASTEADRRKDEFLALLGHELRNPLAPISNALQLLKLPGADAAVSARARETMERQVEHLVRLVDDLLDVSRIMRGKVELRREPIELATVLARAVETSQPVIDAAGHRLTISYDEQPIWIDADAVRMAQVVSNLLNNAAKYTEHGGKILLAASCEANEAVIRVCDTGIGISPEVLPRLFDMFFQVERRTDSSRGGLGIGLSLVRGLVELHGGRVEAQSAGKGRGAEFIIRLPMLSRPGNKPDVRHDNAPRPTQESLRRRVLVVDDNIDAANTLAMLLRLERHEVEVAYDGPSALAKAEAALPAIALLDLGMPEMDGYDLARVIRAHPTLKNMVLVAVTGWGQPEDRQRSAAAGFDHHLVKPLDTSTLRRLLDG
jgi:PAS domain S-box-containing protein